MGTEVLAECEDDAIENAKEELLSNNWYYVHDSIDEWSIEFLWDPTEEELKEHLESLA